MATSPPGGLLDGLRVVDLSLWQPGNAATQLLADLGADVLKVEPPTGDRMRPQGGQFTNFNGHKRSAALDLKNPDDRQRLLTWVAEAEVVVENYRPGVLDRLGIGFDQLRAVNPSIVLCSITGFGQDGPLVNVAGHDHNYQAYAGSFTFHDDDEPTPASLLLADQSAGLGAAFTILAAVMCARRTGEAEHIDLSMTALLCAWVAPYGPLDAHTPGSRSRSELPALGVFRSSDERWIEVGVYSEDHLWDGLVAAVGLEEFVGIDIDGRAARAAELRAALAARFAKRTRDELVDDLGGRGLPIAPVLTRNEMMDHPFVIHRGVLVVDDDGRRRMGHPFRYREHPARDPGLAPSLDEHGRVGFG
ncbi:MAG: CaiB/BaiF CoA transferase family protein [Acidimicrobiia bacterium]